jgi:hypothetical protein
MRADVIVSFAELKGVDIRFCSAFTTRRATAKLFNKLLKSDGELHRVCEKKKANIGKMSPTVN